MFTEMLIMVHTCQLGIRLIPYWYLNSYLTCSLLVLWYLYKAFDRTCKRNDPVLRSKRSYFRQDSVQERKNEHVYVCGAGKGKLRVYSDNDIQVHLGACLDLHYFVYLTVTLTSLFLEHPLLHPNNLCNKYKASEEDQYL